MRPRYFQTGCLEMTAHAHTQATYTRLNSFSAFREDFVRRILTMDVIDRNCVDPRADLTLMPLAVALKDLLTRPEDLAGHAVHPGPALCLLDGYLRSLTSLEEPPSAELAPIIGVHLLDLVAAAFGPTAEAAEIVAKRGVKAARVQAILAEIARHFSDPEFELDSVARTLSLSRRYVQQLVEPVSGSLKRKLEKPEQRLASQPRRLGSFSASFPGQKLRRICLSLGNIVNSHTPRTNAAETGLAGWGERIRTSELQKLRPSNCRVRCEGVEREDRRANMRKIGACWSPVVEDLVQVSVDIERRAAQRAERVVHVVRMPHLD